MLIYAGLGKGTYKKRKSDSSRDLIDVWGLPHLNKVIILEGNRIPNGDLIEFLG